MTQVARSANRRSTPSGTARSRGLKRNTNASSNPTVGITASAPPGSRSIWRCRASHDISAILTATELSAAVNASSTHLARWSEPGASVRSFLPDSSPDGLHRLSPVGGDGADMVRGLFVEPDNSQPKPDHERRIQLCASELRSVTLTRQ